MKLFGRITTLAMLLSCVLCLCGLTGGAANAAAAPAYYEYYQVWHGPTIVSENYETGAVTFKLVTNADTSVLRLYTYDDVDSHDSSRALASWKASGNSTLVDGSKYYADETVREWTVSYTFDDVEFETYYIVMETADGGWDSVYFMPFDWLDPYRQFASDDGDGYIWDGNYSVNYDTGELVLDELWAHYSYPDTELWLYDDDGTLLKKWTQETADRHDVEEGHDVWWCSYTFAETHRRDVTLVHVWPGAGPYAKGATAKITVFAENAALQKNFDVISAAFDADYFAKNTAATATVKTGRDAKYLTLYSGSTKLKTYAAADYSTLSGSERVWNVSVKFTSAGARTITFKASADNSTFGVSKNAKVLITSGNSISVNSAAFASDYVVKGSNVKITVKTGADAKYLRMYLGGTVIKTWSAENYSTISGTQRVWKVTYKFSGTGSKTMTFNASKDKVTFGAAKSDTILVTSGKDINVTSAAFETDYIAKGAEAKITVKTGADARYLRMYLGSSVIKTWSAEDNSTISGTSRVWNVTYKFSGTGTKNMTFKASKDKSTFGTGKSDSILVTSGKDIDVTSAAFANDYIVKGTTVKITAKTGADAKYLVMFSGNSKVTVWKADDYSTISGTTRVWNVSYKINGTGNRKLTFKAGKTTSTFGAAKSDTILVTSGNDISVTSAAFAKTSVKKGTSVTITVKTGADAKYLAMYTEKGAKAKTWNAADCSKISGTSRVWTISYKFSGAGNRTMTFKASKDNSTFGTGKSANITITAN